MINRAISMGTILMTLTRVLAETCVLRKGRCIVPLSPKPETLNPPNPWHRSSSMRFCFDPEI